MAEKKKGKEKPKGPAILVVEDERNMRKTLRSMLGSIGFKNVLEADDGDTAINVLKSEKVKIVICDWIMPRMPGVELLRAMKESKKWRTIPFVMITSEISNAQVAKIAEEEVAAYIIKPFIAETLQLKIQSILQKMVKPSELESLLKTGQRYKEDGQYKKALNDFKKARGIKPKSARILCAIAESYEFLGQEKKAEESYREAISYNPQYLKAQQGIGNFFVKHGENEKAMKFFQRAASISPNNSQRQLAISQIHVKNGNMKQAAQAADAAIKSDPKNAKIQAEAGEMFLECGMAEKAAETFKNSLALNEDVHVYNRLGIALRRKKKYKEAIETYKKAIKVEPDNEVVHYNLGRAFLEAKQMEAALISFKKAIKIDPHFDECKEMLKKMRQYNFA